MKKEKISKSKKTVHPKSWGEFQKSGMLWWINRILHLFGWVIVIDVDMDGNIKNAYPARTIFRGFTPESDERGFKNLTLWLSKNIKELKKEVEEN